MALSDAQREVLEILADNVFCYTTMRRTESGSVNRIAAARLVELGLALWLDEPHRVEITAAGRAEVAT